MILATTKIVCVDVVENNNIDMFGPHRRNNADTTHRNFGKSTEAGNESRSASSDSDRPLLFLRAQGILTEPMNKHHGKIHGLLRVAFHK